MAGICASLFFLGSSVTGNVIGNLEKSSGIWTGIILFITGLAGVAWYFKRK